MQHGPSFPHVRKRATYSRPDVVELRPHPPILVFKNYFRPILPVQQYPSKNDFFLIKIDQLDVTCFIISLFNAQHV